MEHTWGNKEKVLSKLKVWMGPQEISLKSAKAITR